MLTISRTTLNFREHVYRDVMAANKTTAKMFGGGGEYNSPGGQHGRERFQERVANPSSAPHRGRYRERRHRAGPSRTRPGADAGSALPSGPPDPARPGPLRSVPFPRRRATACSAAHLRRRPGRLRPRRGSAARPSPGGGGGGSGSVHTGATATSGSRCAAGCPRCPGPPTAV